MAKVKAKKPPHRLDAITRMIPGYDAWATAEDCHFDYELAERACRFFPQCLTHVKGEWAGKPLILEEWQEAIIANLFGWIRPDGTRRYRSCLIYVARKNAKTTLAAGIALYLMYCDNEPGAEIYSAAANEEQAALCFNTAKGMVMQCPALAKRSEPFRRSITYSETSSTYLVLTAKASTKHGLNPHGIILDELHAHKDRELADTMTSAVGARRQPLTLYTTTADFGRPSICNETHRYAGQVRDGIVEDISFLPVIYEATRDDDWTSEATWKKANPNYGVSVKPDFLRDACKKAKDAPANENTFKRLHLNIITEQADRWLPMDKWDACAGDIAWPDLEAAMAGRDCFAGLDLASTTDLACLSLIFPIDDQLTIIPYFWIPRDTALARQKAHRVPYIDWARDGALTATEGNVIDYDVIRSTIGALGEKFNIKEVAIDRWASAQITNQLLQDGFEVVPFGQGFVSLSAPSKELEKNILAGTVSHGGHPVLRWNASNVSTEQDSAGNIKPSKKRSPEKIDGVIATVMGVGRLMARDLASGVSIYEKQGLASL